MLDQEVLRGFWIKCPELNEKKNKMKKNHFLRFLVVCKTKKMNKINFYKFI